MEVLSKMNSTPIFSSLQVTRDNRTSSILVSTRSSLTTATLSSGVLTSTQRSSFSNSSFRSSMTMSTPIPSSSTSLPRISSDLTTNEPVTSLPWTSVRAPETNTIIPSMMLPASSLESSSSVFIQATATDLPLVSRPQKQVTMSKAARITFITLGVFSFIALVLGISVCLTRRRRKLKEIKQNWPKKGVLDTRSISLPTTSKLSSSTPGITWTNGAGRNAQLTRSPERSDAAIGAAQYGRSGMTTTEGRNVSAPLTSNLFQDPQRTKTYNVLEQRSRPTNQADRGSWVSDPFQDPDIQRSDAFDGMHALEKNKRARQLDEQRRDAELRREYEETERAREIGARQAAEMLREAELAREYEEMERAFEAKQAMGLAPEGLRMPYRR